MFRVSIRESLVLMAFLGAGLAALKYAGGGVQSLIFAGVTISLMVFTVLALVDRGRNQAIACGFASCLAIYLALFICTDYSERQEWATTKVLARMYQAMMTQKWVDRRTGAEVAYDSRWAVVGFPDNIGGIQSPNEVYFTNVGHLLWALFFGYLGGHFAVLVASRRDRRIGREIAGQVLQPTASDLLAEN